MTKMKELVHLDFVTVKPYFTAKNLLLFSAVALFLTAMSGSMSSGVGVGMMIATLFVSYPFAISEKSNLDALYTTLSVKRKTVVQGRYIFTLLLNACAVMFSFVLATAGTLIAKATGFSPEASGDGYIVSLLILSVIFIFIQAIQLPVFFKLGYTKAKALSIVPFAVLMAVYTAFMAMQNINSEIAGFLEKLSVQGAIVPLIAVVLAGMIIASYVLSVSFYKKSRVLNQMC